MRLIMVAKNVPNEPSIRYYQQVYECASIEYREITYDTFIYALIIAKEKANDNDTIVAIRRLDDDGRVIRQDDTITDVPLRDIIEDTTVDGYIGIDVTIGYVGSMDLRQLNKSAKGNINKFIHEFYEDYLTELMKVEEEKEND